VKKNAAPPPAEWTDVAGAARLLGLTENAVRARVARRQLPYRKLGPGRLLFNLAELADFLGKAEGVGVGEALANATQAAAR
jgi:hypothetical protein